MTQDDQESWLKSFRAMLPDGLTADRCRHETVTEPSLHLFRGNAQIGFATLQPDWRWRCGRMRNGFPVSTTWEDTLPGALHHIVT